MKGIFKGFRYISQFFVDGSSREGEEQDMVIGHPTDVKHVAHIGWDGPSAANPTWMNEFRSAPGSLGGAEDSAELAAEVAHTRFPSHDLLRSLQGQGLSDANGGAWATNTNTGSAQDPSAAKRGSQLPPNLPQPRNQQQRSPATGAGDTAEGCEALLVRQEGRRKTKSPRYKESTSSSRASSTDPVPGQHLRRRTHHK